MTFHELATFNRTTGQLPAVTLTCLIGDTASRSSAPNILLYAAAFYAERVLTAHPIEERTWGLDSFAVAVGAWKWSGMADLDARLHSAPVALMRALAAAAPVNTGLLQAHATTAVAGSKGRLCDVLATSAEKLMIRGLVPSSRDCREALASP